jgi:hypothetical protein
VYFGAGGVIRIDVGGSAGTVTVTGAAKSDTASASVNTRTSDLCIRNYLNMSLIDLSRRLLNHCLHYTANAVRGFMSVTIR